MFLIIVCLLVLLFFMHRRVRGTNQIVVDGYSTMYFDEFSRQMCHQMEDAGLSDQSIKEFAIMQDQLLKYQRDSVCYSTNRLLEAIELSNQIKDRFVGFDFTRHQQYISQISNPDKKISPELICVV